MKKSRPELIAVPPAQGTPLLFVLSGPSGVGKDAVLKLMKEQGYPLHYSVTLTTRPKREVEQDGVDYYFTSVEEFRRMSSAGDLLEWAQVYGNYYGIPRAQVRAAMAKGLDVLLKVDVQGAATVKRLAPDAVSIFLAPPSLEELEQRLVQRNTEPSDLPRRLQAAREEMNSLPFFDYAVVNHFGALEEAALVIQAIVIAEKCRTKPRNIDI